MGIIAARVWKYVDRRSVEECWPWLGPRNSSGAGHGVAYVGHGKSIAAHRAVYQLLVRPLDRSEICDHLCRNPICCNPAHIQPGTQAANVGRGRVGESNRIRAAQRTHCPAGHEYTPENTRMAPSGRNRQRVRVCRTCERERNRLYRQSRTR